MKAIVNSGPNRLELKELPLPEPKAGEVRIRTAACGICATDLHMISGWDRVTYPVIAGHEWSGTVDAVGRGVDRRWLGRQCVGENVLADGGEVGFEHPGGYGEYFLTEAANLRFLPEGYSLAEATLIEPLAVCVRGIKRLRLEDRSSAIIFGDGPIGLLMLWLLRQSKVNRILFVGGRNTRLKLAEELGAEATLNYHTLGNKLAGEIQRVMPAGFTNVVEASGSEYALRACLEVARNRGKVLIIGEYGQVRLDLAANHLLLHELELIGSNASEGAWDEAVRLATTGGIPLTKLISNTVPASEFEEGMELALRSQDTIKVVLKWVDDNACS